MKKKIFLIFKEKKNILIEMKVDHIWLALQGSGAQSIESSFKTIIGV